MANAIPTDPAAAAPLSSTAPAAAATPAATASSVPAAAPVITALAVDAVPPSVTVDLSPAAQFLSTVAQSQEQLSQLQAAAISGAALQQAIDSLSALAGQPAAQAADLAAELPPNLAVLQPVLADEQTQLNTNPALAAAIAAYRLNESPAAALATRAAQLKRALVNPIPSLSSEESVESETDASIEAAQQQDPERRS